MIPLERIFLPLAILGRSIDLLLDNTLDKLAALSLLLFATVQD